MKSCSKCKRTDVKFHKNKNKPDGLQSQCAECKSKTDSFYHQVNSDRQVERVKTRRRKIRQFIYDYLKSHPCIDCGEIDPIVLEFDHRANKEIQICDMVRAGHAISRVEKEIAKCDVRCANCHKKKTAKDFNWYKDLIV